MPIQANWIAPALSLLSQNPDSVLPAVGGAMEDLLVNSETHEVTEFLETPPPSIANLY